MFPYFDTNHWHAGRFALHPFWALVILAIAVGFHIGSMRGERSGIPRNRVAALAVWVIIAGLVGGHLAKFLYAPGAARLTLRGWNAADIFNGQAAFGAFFGAYVAALVFFWRHSIPYRDWFLYSDAGAFAVPFAWWIGRVGCYLVHDHPGVRTNSWLGVPYPGGARYDLGLLEVFFLLALAGTFLLLDRKPRPRGFYQAAFLLSYGVFRFLLDRLHQNPPRYGGWTVDQIFSMVLIVAGVVSVVDVIRLRRPAT